MRNEENPRAGGSETGDACRQKKWRGGFLKKPPPPLPAWDPMFAEESPATPPQKYL